MELQSEPSTVDDAELKKSETNGHRHVAVTVPVSAANAFAQKSAELNASHASTTAERRPPQPPLASKLNRTIMFVGALLIAFGCWQTANNAGDSTDPKPSRGIATQRIDQIEVGQQVVAKNPTDDVDLSLGEAIDPSEWRKLELRAPKSDGSWSDVTLLRPLAWLESEQRTVDGKIRVTVPECGIDGDADLLAVQPCPPVEHTPGCRTVTGVFRHHSADVIDVHVAGLDSPIGATGNHPFWSEDRQDFVRADRLRPGETLRSFDGLLTVIKTTPRPTPEPVYNIEVHVDHVYHVTTAGILVHNAEKCPVVFTNGTRDNPVQIGSGRIKWVDDTPTMSQAARNYEDAASGAKSNSRTRKRQVPVLERVLSDGTRRPVKFDGIEGNVLIDRKVSVTSFKKAKDQARRQSEALRQNGYLGRWEVKSAAQAARARRILKELGITNIDVRVVP